MNTSLPLEGRHGKTANSCRALIRRAAKAHRAHRIAADAKAEIDRLKDQNAPLTVAEREGLRRLLYLIGRGQTSAGKLNSARLRSIWADPVRRAEFLALRAAAEEASRLRPRHRGRWLPDPAPSPSERSRQKKLNYSRASSARFADPIFRDKVVNQLAEARALRKYHSGGLS